MALHKKGFPGRNKTDVVKPESEIQSAKSNNGSVGWSKCWVQSTWPSLFTFVLSVCCCCRRKRCPSRSCRNSVSLSFVSPIFVFVVVFPRFGIFVRRTHCAFDEEIFKPSLLIGYGYLKRRNTLPSSCICHPLLNRIEFVVCLCVINRALLIECIIRMQQFYWLTMVIALINTRGLRWRLFIIADRIIRP